MEIDGIDEKDEIIITYCDFTVKWNYEQFKRSTYGCDGSIVSFKGFHPASYGHTYYAYMRVEDDNFLELREKNSFTNQRDNEHASAGIYYFKSWKIFKEFGNKIIKNKDPVLKEAYVSLLYNPMFEKNMSIKVFLCDKFICLGTPEDYEEYNFWYSVYKKSQKKISNLKTRNNTVTLMPLAGSGRRFQEEGYRTPKSLIKIDNKPMVQKAIESLPSSKNLIFVHKKSNFEKHNLEKKFKELFSNSLNVLAKIDTTGQAATCLLAKKHLSNSKELLIASCDYEHYYNFDKWEKILNHKSIDGAIWTYRMKNVKIKNRSFCLLFDTERWK